MDFRTLPDKLWSYDNWSKYKGWLTTANEIRNSSQSISLIKQELKPRSRRIEIWEKTTTPKATITPLDCKAEPGNPYLKSAKPNCIVVWRLFHFNVEWERLLVSGKQP